jgi:hypothetical protein
MDALVWWNAVLGEAFVPLAHGVLDGQATFEFLTNVLGSPPSSQGCWGTGALGPLTVMVRLFQCAGHCDVSMCSVQGAPCDVQGALCDVQCAVCSV